jgi:triacylglycerol lipase
MRVIERALRARGRDVVKALDFAPASGAATISDLASQVDHEARALASNGPIDVVGFSMGALVGRFWIKRRGGADLTRRYVSIAGPHHGTRTAHLWPTAGGRDMRPGSELVADLASDEGDWNGEAAVVWNPLDLMIVPATSARLEGTTISSIPVALHGLMPYDRRVVAAVIDFLDR